MEEKTKGIKGLNIATIVLLAITIGASLVFAATFASFINYLFTSATVKSQIMATLSNNPDLAQLTTGEIAGLLSGTIWGITIGYILVCVVMIIGSALTISRVAKRPNEIGGVMGWSIAGIILSFLTGHIICFILYIISTVKISNAKN